MGAVVELEGGSAPTPAARDAQGARPRWTARIGNRMRLDPLFDAGMRLHALAPWYLAADGRALPAVRVAFELTYRCNLECPLCFQMPSKEQGGELDTATWLRLADEVPRYALVNVTGGEPFVKKGAMEIIERVLDRHQCTILTNGVLLDEERIRRLVDRKLLVLGISIDGVGAVHDRFRGKVGTFARVSENLALLRDHKRRTGRTRPLLDIKAVLTADTAPGIEALYDLAEEYEASFLTLSMPKLNDIQFHANLVSGLDDAKVQTLPPSPQFVDPGELQRRIERLIEKSKTRKTKIRTYPRLTAETGIDAFFADSPLPSRYQPCYEPWSGIQIAPNGDVYPCLAHKLGNVRDEPLGAIWNGARAREFRRRLRAARLFPGCAGCCYLRGR